MVTLQANAQAIGMYRQLEQIINLDAEQIEEVLIDDDYSQA